MKKNTKGWIILISTISLFFLYVLFKPAPALVPKKPQIVNNFDDFFENKLKISKAKKVRKNNEEKLARYSGSQTNFAILYIHGFGASRAEGEKVVDSISAKLKANTYYLRLPGHGTNKSSHAEARFSDYIYEAEEALAMMSKLGKKTIVIGTSMGGLLATYLAATYPKEVDALILCSPFYDYAHPAGNLVNIPGMVNLVSFFDSKGRITLPVEEIEAGKVLPQYPEYWYTEQEYEALLSLEDLKDFAATEAVFKKVSAPTLLFYYYKNEEEQDKAASVPAMLKAFELFGASKNKSLLKRKVNVVDGNHVMFSKYVYANQGLILSETFRFIDEAFMEHHISNK